MRRPLTLKQSALILALFGMLGIVLYNTRDILFGAPLRVTTLSNGMHLSESYLAVTGSAPHAKSVLINGRTIFINRKGEFTEPILLSPGYNVIEVGMTDRFGNTKAERYELVFTEEEKYTLVPDPHF